MTAAQAEPTPRVELTRLDSAEVRQRLVDALQVLATDLFAHLDFEEEQVSPTLRTWTRWPDLPWR